MSFALQAESMDEAAYARFVKELPVEPGIAVSHGTAALRALMGGAMSGR